MEQQPQDFEAIKASEREKFVKEFISGSAAQTWSSDSQTVLRIGLTTLHKVIEQRFEDRWNSLSYMTLQAKLRKNPDNQKEDPFLPLKTALKEKQVQPKSSGQVIRAFVERLIETKRSHFPGKYVNSSITLTRKLRTSENPLIASQYGFEHPVRAGRDMDRVLTLEKRKRL